MDLERRKQIHRKEADELNMIALQNHHYQKNNQIMMKQQEKMSAMAKQKPTLMNQLY